MTKFEIPDLFAQKFSLQIGIHSGSVVSGVIGSSMPHYCVFGDTVGICCHMEKTGQRWFLLCYSLNPQGFPATHPTVAFVPVCSRPCIVD
ncbi:MAG: hypothetical protein GY696_06525 [Gammaproteobacteria bacterium]|nr:hypothetical protein [Gammaproteobacteria bacterium]